MDDKITMSHDCVENLREGVGRLANEWTKIAEGTEETSAVAEGIVVKIADEGMGFGVGNVKRHGNVAKNRECE